MSESWLSWLPWFHENALFQDGGRDDDPRATASVALMAIARRS
jgi:hypothetical protein